MNLQFSLLDARLLLEKNCDYCNENKGVYQCGKCKVIKYCTVDCQKLAWKSHKLWCCSQESTIQDYLKKSFNNFPNILHYAVRPNWKQLSQLAQNFLNYPIETPIGKISPKQIQQLCSIPKPGPTKFLFEDEQGQQKFLSQEEHYQKFGTYFFEGNHIPRKDLYTYLSTQVPTVDHTQSTDLSVVNYPTHKAIVDRFNENPPKVMVKIESPKQGFGLAALDSIKEGEIICIIGGLRTFEPSTTARGIMHNFGDLEGGAKLDQTEYSGYGHFVNDGPINSYWGRVWGDATIPPETLVLRASRNVKAGEFLHACYGIQHPIRVIPYSLNPQQINELYEICESRHDPFNYFTQVIEGQLNVSSSRFIHHNGIVDLIFSSIYVFFKLILNQKLDLNSMIAFLKLETTEAFFAKQRFSFAPRHLIGALNNLAPIMNKPSIVKALDHSLENLCQHAWYHMIKSVPKNYPINKKTLQAHLEKAENFDVLLRFLLPFYFVKIQEEEGKEEEEGESFDSKAFLTTFRNLPAPLQDSKLLTFLIKIYTRMDRLSSKDLKTIHALIEDLNK